MSTYDERVRAQIAQYSKGVDAQALPDIFHYWANRHLRPKIVELFGVNSIPEFFASPMIELAKDRERIDILSIGSGDCNVEIDVAKILRDRIGGRFRIVATELSPLLIKEANAGISNAGLSDLIVCQETDLNNWSCPENGYDAAMTSHSLHHIVELEHVFTEVKKGLRSGGVFAISDMIGRNGHMRWPEALEIMQRFWAILPDSHRYNHILKRLEPEYINYDCSGEGFEGIRAQDILPLLLMHFYPGRFLVTGGLTDVFVDRAFGHNFDKANDFDREFIELVSYINEVLLRMGGITPTLMLAYFHVDPVENIWIGTPPNKAVRWPHE